MSKEHGNDDKHKLRKRAEKLLPKETDELLNLSKEKIQQFVHELRTYQIELELQNEDLRNSQAELLISQKKYTDLYDFSPVSYVTINEKGLIVEANLTAAEMLGTERILLIKNPISNFIVPEDQNIYYKHRKILVESRNPQTCELRIRRKDSTSLHAQLEFAIIQEIDGGSGQYRVCLIDISKRKILEDAVKHSKKEWEQTFDGMHDIVTIQDKDRRIIKANKAAHKTFNAEYGALNGKRCYEVFRCTDKPCSDCSEILSLDNYNSNEINITHDNLEKIFHVTASPIRNENGEFTSIVHIAKDITDRKKMEEELFQAHKMEAIGTLAGGIAHDFNNILSAIIGYSELAKDSIPVDSSAQKYIDTILKASKRAADLVKQILTFSRKSTENQQSLMPHLIVKEALQMLRASLPTTINIEEHIDIDCGLIMADRTNVHQIVVNLCTNALHAMENEKGTLTVTLCNTNIQKEDIVDRDVSPGSFIIMSIRDTGHGMDKKTMERIFEPYFTTKEMGKGSGLGLAVIHGIVRSYRGFIRVESEPGEGTSFHVYIPALEDIAPTYTKTEFHDTSTGTERILVVDDENYIADLNKMILERLGYTVTATTSSEEALDLIHLYPDRFDLIITDQTMPNLSGVELAEKILNLKPSIPVILCTGYSSVITKEEALAIGIKKYARKPVNRSTLVRIVRQVLDDNKE